MATETRGTDIHVYGIDRITSSSLQSGLSRFKKAASIAIGGRISSKDEERKWHELFRQDGERDFEREEPQVQWRRHAETLPLLRVYDLYGNREFADEDPTCERDLRLDNVQVSLLPHCAAGVEKLGQAQPVAEQVLQKSGQGIEKGER